MLPRKTNLTGTGSRPDGYKHMKTAAPGGLGKGSQAESFQGFLYKPSGARGIREVSRLGIDVEGDPIWLSEGRDPTVGNVHCDATEIDQG